MVNNWVYVITMATLLVLYTRVSSPRCDIKYASII
jgi:hypothetical protein